MKVIVLGAGGFVGVNVLPYLLRAGFEVVGVFRSQICPRTRGVLDGVRWISLEDILHWPEFEVRALVSFAGVGTPSVFEADPERLLDNELEIADLIADLAPLHAVRSVVCLSTAGAIYGEGRLNGNVNPQAPGTMFTESSPCLPISVYGRSKFLAEARLAAGLARKAPGCWRSLKIDHLCSLKIDQGMSPRGLPLGVAFDSRV